MSGIQNSAHLRLVERECDCGERRVRHSISEDQESEKLGPGFYLVLWSARPKMGDGGRKGRFFGPFASLAQAEKLRVSAEALGLVEPGPIPAELPSGAIPEGAAARRRARYDGSSIILAGQAL